MAYKNKGRGPVRTCKVCGRKAPQKGLCRFVWSDGKPVADENKQMLGRGAYCCNREECLSGFWGWEKKWKTAFRL